MYRASALCTSSRLEADLRGVQNRQDWDYHAKQAMRSFVWRVVP